LKRSYHTITTTNARRLAEFFSRNGQGLLPMVDLIEQSRLAVDELKRLRRSSGKRMILFMRNFLSC
jgi:hypothetical protein